MLKTVYDGNSMAPEVLACTTLSSPLVTTLLVCLSVCLSVCLCVYVSV